jgi:hypothetical protein
MRRAGLALLALLAFPAAAAAQTPPVPTPVAPTPTPIPTPVAPAKATLATTVRDTFGRPHPAALTGRGFTARVVMKPFVANERAVLRIFRDGKQIRAKSLAFRPIRGGSAGEATVKLKWGKPGRVRLKAVHLASATVATARSKSISVEVVRPSAGPGARGPAVQLLQSKLAALHYVVPRTGVYDAGTGRAVLAWRKLLGKSRTIYATKDVFFGLLKGRGAFKVRHPHDGHHVEARLNTQVMALIDRGKVQRIYHISSGKPSTPTVRGRFRVYMKTPGTNSHGMVDSSYFIRGYAIHGYFDVPTYNASHGCLRVPIPNARSIYDWLRIGDVVWVEP